jgi:hypothetical protein
MPLQSPSSSTGKPLFQYNTTRNLIILVVVALAIPLASAAIENQDHNKSGPSLRLGSQQRQPLTDDHRELHRKKKRDPFEEFFWGESGRGGRRKKRNGSRHKDDDDDSKGSKSSKSGSSSKGSKGSKSSSSSSHVDSGDYHPWYPEPSVPPHNHPVPPHNHPEECKHFKIKFGAIQAPAQETVPADGGASNGAEFIYNSPLFEDAGLTTPVGDPNEPAAFVTGVCIRFQESMSVEGTDNTIAGAGSCDWTYTLNIDGLEGTLEVSGELFDSVKSTLSITGGTNGFVGAEGQVELIPSPTGNIDIFTGVDYYNVSAVVYIEECEAQYWKWWENHRGYWDWDA